MTTNQSDPRPTGDLGPSGRALVYGSPNGRAALVPGGLTACDRARAAAAIYGASASQASASTAQTA